MNLEFLPTKNDLIVRADGTRFFMSDVIGIFPQSSNDSIYVTFRDDRENKRSGVVLRTNAKQAKEFTNQFDAFHKV